MNGATPLKSTALVAVLLLSAVAGAGVIAASATSPDDGSMEQATPIEPGESVDDVVESSDDADWYEVQVEDDRTLLLSLSKRDIDAEGNTMDRELTFALYDADGEKITETTLDPTGPSGPDKAFAERLDGGTYYVEVAAAYGEESEGKQGYSLDTKTVETDPNEPNDTPENATPLGGSADVSTNVFGNDLDYYSVDVDAGETVTVDYTENLGDTDRDARTGHAATIYDPSGDRLDVEDIGDENQITFTASEDGRYLVFVHPDEGGRILSLMQVTQYDLTVEVTDDSQGDDADEGDAGDGDDSQGDDADEGDDSQDDDSEGDDSENDEQQDDSQEQDDGSKEGDCAV